MKLKLFLIATTALIGIQHSCLAMGDPWDEKVPAAGPAAPAPAAEAVLAVPPSLDENGDAAAAAAVLSRSPQQAEKVPGEEAFLRAKELEREGPIEAAALDLYLESAEQGHPRALSALSNLASLLEGKDEDRPSRHKALALLKKAAEKGYLPAMLKLIVIYTEGKIVEQNIEESRKLSNLVVKQVAQIGDPETLDAINDFIRSCLDNPANPDSVKEFSVQLLQELAKGGDPQAQYFLSFLYKEGRGVEKNEGESERLYNLAMDKDQPGKTPGQRLFEIAQRRKGSNQATQLLLSVAEEGHEAALKELIFNIAPTAEPILMALCYGIGARHNHPLALVRYGNLLRKGYPEVGIEKNVEEGKKQIKEGLKFFEKAVEREKDPYSMLFLGQFYLDGEGVEKDLNKAFKLLRGACKIGKQIGKPLILKTLYEKAKNFRTILSKVEEGNELLEILCKEKYPPALLKLGQLHQDKTLKYYMQIFENPNPDTEILDRLCDAVVKSDNYRIKLPVLEKLAEKNHAEALFELGKIYGQGLWGEKVNKTKCFKYFEQACKKDPKILDKIFLLAAELPKDDQAYISSLYKLLEEHNYGPAFHYLGLTSRDPGESKKYFERGAALGHPGCLCKMGELLTQNQVTFREGLKLLFRAAKANNQVANYYLGRLFDDGTNVGKDLEQAKEYYRAAIKAPGDEAPLSMVALARIFLNSKEQSENLEGLKLVKEIETLGQHSTLYLVGNIFLEKKKFRPALKYYAQSAEQNYLPAMVAQAQLLLSGEDKIQPNPLEALRLFNLAASASEDSIRGDVLAARAQAEALETLGCIHEKGVKGTSISTSIEPHMLEACRFYQAAAEKGKPLALFNLGMILLEGRPEVEKNGSRAVQLLKEAAEKGYPAAQSNLGALYEIGREGVVEEDEKQARSYYEAAAQQGHKDAMFNLGRLLLKIGERDSNSSKIKKGKEWLAKVSEEPRKLLERVQTLLQQRRKEEAQELMGQAMSMYIPGINFIIGRKPLPPLTN